MIMGEESMDLKEVRIPQYIIEKGAPRSSEYAPKWPMLIFVNPRSGKQVGMSLLDTLYSSINSHQVFDMNKCHPEDVLERVMQNMERLKEEGDNVASEIRKRLRIVIAGGDGTINWILGALADLKLEEPPPVATLPFGTGNNIAFTFGWGKKDPETTVESLKQLLKHVIEAYPMQVDSWHLAIAAERQHDLGAEPPIPLHVFRRSDDSLEEETSQLYRGGFWNYFAIGMDAEVAYGFSTKRQQNPEKFKNQYRNQSVYAQLGCTQGWFCVSCFHPFSRNIGQISKVYTAHHNGEWKELILPSYIRSLVLLNLPSFSGGLNPWGTPNDQKSKKRGLTTPSVNDGLLEIVGFRDAWDGLSTLLPKGHSTRLAQAHRVKLEFRGKKGDQQTHAHIDGEPWKQPLPEHNCGTTMEVSHHGQLLLLARKGCIAENKEAYQHTVSFTREGIEHGLHRKPLPPHKQRHNLDKDIDNTDGDESKLKFGAASSLDT